ncbi:N,N-dimethylformamidase beta subunit family domain-containing protein [Teichococcus aestuarii]|uniref:N,N-dimethylformamidase large subunit n=1 Tax=Teichococcus aestuarii TaxID=568898 RepID=A0A2U1V432_9PROT|nr:N,N-dimethylformamidase beta subunit family domain-containing protein [Pseudoroseomonas aestuarii]PWC28678.1 N,N-dimethylformamidase large subunit [Pseudoroseomonas aestuarii]
MTVPLTGYLDRISARPGERLAVKVSSTLPGDYEADLVRVISGDPNPAGPGLILRPVPAAFAGRYPGRFQPTHLGSCALVAAMEGVALPPDPRRGLTLGLRVQPWLLTDQPAVLMARQDAAGHGWRLSLSKAGPVFEAQGPGGHVRCALAAPPLPRAWYALTVEIRDGTVRLTQAPLRKVWGAGGDAGAAEAAGFRLDTLPAAPLSIGATWRDGAPHAVFDGRLEDPFLCTGGAPPAGPAEGPGLLAWWDFSVGIDTQSVVDRGPRGLHGRLVNLPTRAVRGSRWDGSAMAWTQAPRHYAAIHFHADDLADCGWETDFHVEIPAGLPSGAYGVRLRAGGQEDIIPFYVLPPRGMATARVAFLASSFTYQAYANHARGNADAAYRARRDAWGAYPHNPDDHHDYAHSTYNRHPDNSGVALSSRLRPILTWRPGFLTFNDARGSGLRHYPADTHLIAWADALGIEMDILTDEDLDNEGVELLRPYKVVLTGSHPEYHTPGTLDALQAYVGTGGRLCYLGGNGFYWRVARRPDLPHVIEVRRAEGGIRAWAAETGEYYQQLDGGYGGLWRRNGRPPQMLAGVGFSSQGLFEGSHYRRLPESRAPDMAWIFEGIEGDILGDFGLSGGGAAGFELDRADPSQGSPPNIRILARSEGHQSHFVAVPEELLSHVNTVTGERPAALIRAEIVYFETAQGGAVFSTGSITFCGSLPHNGFDNPVSRMLRNVVTRFASERLS